jgi:hypothetical protein
MAKHLGLAIMIFGLSGIVGCAQAPVGDETEVAPVPRSTVTYARAAVEVGRIELAQMPAFEAFVERMDVGERTALWLTLKELHDSVHPSQAPEDDAPSRSVVTPLEDFGCRPAACSHSDRYSETAQWCCALGEDYLFFMNDSAE